MRIVVSIFFIYTLVSLSGAVIISGGDGTGNTSAPTGDQGWSNVGWVGGDGSSSSTVYLDNQWFITANHVKDYENPTSITLNGSQYSVDNSSWTRITNTTDGTGADLIMYRVNEMVSDPSMSVISSTPANGTAVTMIGAGRDRKTSTTYWDAVWDEVPLPQAVYGGYKWDSGATKRWGINTVEASGATAANTSCFYTDFDISIDEAQAATHDSGGGVFIEDGEGGWELAGIMIAMATYKDQPSETSAYNTLTYSADLSDYQEQINNTLLVPEPTALVLISLFSGLCLILKRIFY